MSLIPFTRDSFKKSRDRHHLLRTEIERLNALPGHVRVLEWGSGLSTILLLETLKEDSFTLSIEYDKKYLFEIPDSYSRRLKQIYLKTQKPLGGSDAYITHPIEDVIRNGEAYDLVIIDGRNRADCLAVSALLLKPEGSVILCDSERERYQIHYNLFEEVHSFPAPDSCFKSTLLRKPICTLTGRAPLSSGITSDVMPVRKQLPCTWGVCAVALPRESYYWLRDWIDHHIRAGASIVTIYDNTGSVKSQRGSSPFCGGRFQREQISKRGEEYGRLTSHLTDEQISRELREIAASYNGKVEIIDWKPKHTKEDIIIHAQVEAYCDFIRRHRDTLGWGFFIDLDEYIYCRPGLTVNRILKYVEKEHPTVSALHLTDWEFECRWGKDGPKDITKLLICHPTKHNCGKILARLQDITHANVHWDWILKSFCSRLRVHPDDMAFAHYMQLPEDLPDDEVRILPRLFLRVPGDPDTTPRLISHFHIDNCGSAALPVETTFVQMFDGPNPSLKNFLDLEHPIGDKPENNPMEETNSNPSLKDSPEQNNPPSILIGIESLTGSEDKRNTLRKTCLAHNSPGISYRFFVKSGTSSPKDTEDSTYLSSASSDAQPGKDKPDFLQYALDNYDFDWLFRCDDETYICTDRLSGLIEAGIELIVSNDFLHPDAPIGNPVYLISRSLLEQLLKARKGPLPEEQDFIRQNALKLGEKVKSTSQFNSSPSPFPSKDNNIVTAHKCSPDILYFIDHLQTAGPSPIAIYDASHQYWTDQILFYNNGFFMRKESGCSGRYILDTHSLRLCWFAWGEEALVRVKEHYLGSQMNIKMNPDSPSCLIFKNKQDDPPLLIQYGSGPNKLEGWINLDLPGFDICKPLCWEDESVEGFFLEHVIEHVTAPDAYRFFKEAYRSLKKGGILRLAYPDVLRIYRQTSPEYIAFLQKAGWGNGSPESAIESIVCNHGHKSVWSIETLSTLLTNVGFTVTPVIPGESQHSHFKQLESHGTQLGENFNLIETECLEALKI